MKEPHEFSCATCKLRAKAEAKPRSLVGIIWRLHTYICPGWKAYQRALSRTEPTDPPGV
jgi:hypothetical protein